DGDPVTPAASYSFSNVTADHTIEATFAINTYTLTATAGDHGTITPSGAVAVDHGASQGFTITPATGYHIAGLLVDGDPVTPAASYSFSNVTADHTIEDTFAIRAYTPAATAGDHGSITPSGAVAVDHGASQGFTITPATGYHIAGLLVDGDPVTPAASYSFSNVPADHTIEATFAINTYTLTATAGDHGSITPSGAVAVDHGASQGFTIARESVEYGAGLRVDGDPGTEADSDSFSNVTADHTIDATLA